MATQHVARAARRLARLLVRVARRRKRFALFRPAFFLFVLPLAVENLLSFPIFVDTNCLLCSISGLSRSSSEHTASTQAHSSGVYPLPRRRSIVDSTSFQSPSLMIGRARHTLKLIGSCSRELLWRLHAIWSSTFCCMV